MVDDDRVVLGQEVIVQEGWRWEGERKLHGVVYLRIGSQGSVSADWAEHASHHVMCLTYKQIHTWS